MGSYFSREHDTSLTDFKPCSRDSDRNRNINRNINVETETKVAVSLRYEVLNDGVGGFVNSHL